MTVVPFMTKNFLSSGKRFRADHAVLHIQSWINGSHGFPYKGLKDIVTQARQSSRKLTYGAVSIGLNPSIMKKIAEKEGVELVHMPFGAAGEAETAFLGGHVDMVAGDFNPSFIEAGQTRLVAVWREERADEYPQVPILKELGYDIPADCFLESRARKASPKGFSRRLKMLSRKRSREPGVYQGDEGTRVLRFSIGTVMI